MMGSMMGDPGWGYLVWPVAALVSLFAAALAGVLLLRAAGGSHPQGGPVSAIATVRADALLGRRGGALLVTDPAAPGELRASDADREHVAATLSEHLASGRLTVPEFEQRVTAAYAAKTLGQLRTKLEDLPVAAR